MLATNTQYIVKSPTLEDSQNYVLLREMGIKHIEQLARQIWTDYNVHDSGITILELICYAITDLGYRTGFDIKDLLTEQTNGEDFIDNSVFHTAKDIFPSHPVTFDDLRKMLIDITGVKQAWIGVNKNVYYYLDKDKKKLIYNPIHTDDIPCEPLNGLYDVWIQKEDFVEERRKHALFSSDEVLNSASLIYQSPDNRYEMSFKVRYPLNLVSILLFTEFINPNLPLDLVLHFSKKDNTGTYQELITKNVSIPSELEDNKSIIDIEEDLSIGDWKLAIDGTNVNLGIAPATRQPYGYAGVVELLQGFDEGGNNHYFSFDWNFTFVVSPVEQENLAILPKQNIELGLATVPIPDLSNHVNINNRGLVFNVICPIILEQVSVHADSIGQIKVALLDRNDNEIKSQVIDIETANSWEKIDLNWKIFSGFHYRLKAFNVNGATIKLHRNNPASFPFVQKNVVEILSGIYVSNFNNSYYFFYNWKISYQPCLPQTSEITQADIKKAVKEKLYLNRNLCEDFMNIEVLKTEEIAVCMDLEVRPDADLEEILAEIYYQLELYVSPPVNFYSIQELLDKGKTTDEIFEGPLLDHGFIDHQEFIQQGRQVCLRSSDIIQIIMDVPGVTAVKSISLLSFVAINCADIQFGDTIHKETNENGIEICYRVQQEDWILELQDTNFFAPDFSPNRSKTFFYKNNLPYLANRAEVQLLLTEKRAQQVKSKLRGHQQDLPVPIGTFRNLEDYYPIQNELPETYYTGPNLVPKSGSNLRKAQSNQLKGYLLFFEQILANYLSQLNHVKDLFSWKKEENKPSYFTQKLKEIAQIEKLYIKDYQADLDDELKNIIENEETKGIRRNKFLNHLIGRFSENLTEYGLMMHSLFKDDAARRLIADKEAFLEDYPRVSSQRSKGFDYRFPDEADNLTGFQRRVYRLLGIHDKDCKVKRQNFADSRIRILEKEGKFCFRILTEAVMAEVTSKEAKKETIDYSSYDFEFESNCCDTRQQICILIDALLHFGAQEENWCQLNTNPFTGDAIDTWVLKRNCISCEDLMTWANSGISEQVEQAKQEILGYTVDQVTHQDEFTNLVLKHFQTYAQQEGFHLIENILLRKRTVEEDDDFLPVEIHQDKEDCECVEVKDPYSFRATVVLPSWSSRFRNIRFRQLVEKTLRLEAPAQVYLRICWISHCQMQEFETCHDAWLQAHADLDCEFRGERDLHYLSPPSPEQKTLTDEEKDVLEAYRETLKNLIHKIYNLTNIFAVARIHGCEEVDSNEPQVSLNNTNLGSA